MIFSPDMLEKVLNGTKTQTRRPIKENEWGNYHVFSGRHSDVRVWKDEYAYRVRWAVNRTYAVTPGRGKRAVGRIRILSIRKERPRNISEYDARAEGFESVEAFWNKLRDLYGAKVDLNRPYWAITFELVKE